MGVSDAVVARGMAQRIKRAIPAIQQNFAKQNALLYVAQTKGQMKWGGSHKEVDWYARRDTGTTPSWGGGELGVRTFEELNPADQAKLPYCWIERTYGVSDRTIETNRHATGNQKVYDSLKEALIIAQIKMYDALGPSVWTGGASGDGSVSGSPVGLKWVVGDPCGASAATIAAATSYAGIAISTTAIAAYAAEKANFDGPCGAHWAPFVADIDERPGASTDTWAVEGLYALDWMAQSMAVTKSVSGGTGFIKPDMAFMTPAKYGNIRQLIIAAQASGYQIPLDNKTITIGGFSNMVVGPMTLVADSNVPTDSTNAEAMIFAIDSKAFYIATTHTKAEGLITNDFSATDPLISGAIGVLKANLAYLVKSPANVGVIVGAV